MSSGERSIGAAKGKQTNTEASCQPPAPSGGCRAGHYRGGHWRWGCTVGILSHDPIHPGPCWCRLRTFRGPCSLCNPHWQWITHRRRAYVPPRRPGALQWRLHTPVFLQIVGRSPKPITQRVQRVHPRSCHTTCKRLDGVRSHPRTSTARVRDNRRTRACSRAFVTARRCTGPCKAGGPNVTLAWGGIGRTKHEVDEGEGGGSGTQTFQNLPKWPESIFRV